MPTSHREFEWDVLKASRNLAKHRVSFEDAAEALAGDSFAKENEDDRVDYGEERRISLARLGSRLLMVVWTRPEPNVTRIISARRATRKEWQDYDQRFE